MLDRLYIFSIYVEFQLERHYILPFTVHFCELNAKFLSSDNILCVWFLNVNRFYYAPVKLGITDSNVINSKTDVKFCIQTDKKIWKARQRKIYAVLHLLLEFCNFGSGLQLHCAQMYLAGYNILYFTTCSIVWKVSHKIPLPFPWLWKWISETRQRSVQEKNPALRNEALWVC